MGEVGSTLLLALQDRVMTRLVDSWTVLSVG
jgi:hypothetical protein